MTDRRLPVRLALAACAFFFLAAQPFLPLLGVENDEATFVSAFLSPRFGSTIRIGHFRPTIMLMPYLGTLKAWIYRPIFAMFRPGVWSLREPALAAGAASVWLFFLLLRRIAGARAAVIGCGLLAVDSIYLLTASFDWGPVALQHLLVVGGMLLLVRFYQEGGAPVLASGFFCLGLAMWDKALAVWMLSAISIAALAVFPRQIWRAVTPRRVGIAVAGFTLGALPLIVYNANEHFATFRGQSYDASEIAPKARLLLNTARGDGLFDWLVNDDWRTTAGRQPETGLEKASSGIANLAGNPRRNLLLYAFALALLLAPLARGAERRAMLFALIIMAVEWIQMAVTAGAGLSMHHTILLWPLPQLVVGVSFAAASRRLGRAGLPVAAGILAVTMASGALQINEYYRNAWRNGGSQDWTDAVYPLAEYAKSLRTDRIYCADWGILDSLRLLDDGALPLEEIFTAIPADAGSADMPRIRAALGAPGRVFLAHAKGFEVFAGRDEKLRRAAETAGYGRETIAVISDSFGHPAYEAYRFTRLHDGQ